MSGPCPLCGGTRCETFLSRTGQPVHQHLLADTMGAARAVACGTLDMRVCADCGFVFNAAFDAALLSYDQGYDNSQDSSAHFDRYLDSLVEELVERRGLRGKRIVEVGCGKGKFLRKLVSYPGAGNSGEGFDPSYVGLASEMDGRLRFHTRFFDAACADVQADVIVCRHVIEHVADPLALLRAVRVSGAQVFFETPCVDWILREEVIWDFFYEHCSLFTAASLTGAFARSGFSVDRVDPVFEGQYLLLEARVGGDARAGASAGDTPELARAFGRSNARLIERWRRRLKDYPGRVALWGAGAKGATLANLADPDCQRIDCVIDLNPNKQGRYLPGTGHPIVAPVALAHRGIKGVVMMNPNYRAENEALLAGMGIEVEILDWS